MNSIRKAVVGGALAAAAVTGGAVGATFFGTANAQTTSTTTAPAASTPAPSTPSQPNFPAHGSADHEGQEKAVTGDAATKAQAAAVKSVGSGTAGAVTSDFNGGGYEVTVTKADGSQVEVHLDSSFNVVQGHGHGGGRPNDNDSDDQAGSTTAPAA
ncbi:MAG: hypothetical protein JOZ37_16705 [Actinobacteria bacterium]|nr:hypothetical protein [Actinomycetota bacterium]MBV8960182.1 hypothetical protein [Actinomycetota bacterium]MBV9254060.1 hypothetical protein [Actinomycetota bacterium]MBV9665610.1 hypothetical protein [Actinomycetota bacterium]MBV9936132.1 hypothetical protein [Actinomycetota bacterium]